MALHVDITKVEPLASSKRRLARVVLDEQGGIVIQADDPAYWRNTLTQAVGIDPDQAPQEFLYSLSARVDGTYVSATQPHEEDDCPLVHGAEHMSAVSG
jgi:hypothetical protein